MATSVLKLGDIIGKIFIIASVLGVYYSLLLCRLLEFNVQSRGTSQGVLYLLPAGSALQGAILVCMFSQGSVAGRNNILASIIHMPGRILYLICKCPLHIKYDKP